MVFIRLLHWLKRDTEASVLRGMVHLDLALYRLYGLGECVDRA